MRANLFNVDRTKLMISIGFCAVFLLMLFVASFSMSSLNRVNGSMSDLIHNTDQKTSLAHQMRDAIRLRSTELRTLAQVNEPNGREKIFQKIVQATQNYAEARNSLSSLSANERELEILDNIDEAQQLSATAYDKAGQKIMSMAQDADALKSALGNAQLQELSLLYHLNDLVKLEKTLATEQLQANQAQYKRMRRTLFGSVITAFVVSLLITAAVINQVTRTNKRIQHLANHDDLTGSLNRRSFEQALQHTMQTAKQSTLSSGILYIDFDRFKIVNDTSGHHAGDQLLIQLCTLIKEQLQVDDLFARVGGDEFAVVAQRASFKAIAELAENLRTLVKEFKFQYNGKTFDTSLSIGVLPITGDEVNLETVLQDVDSACYVAKQAGRDRVHVARDGDINLVNYRNDIAGIQDIRRALDNDRLVLFYQPVHQINPQGTEMAHCEILLRIKNDAGELCSPAEFIPIAEKYNLMGEIDRWVISHVFAWVSEHQVERQLPRLLINLSGLSFIDDDFLAFVVDALEEHEVDPAKIAFELTETAAVDNIAKANEFIDQLSKVGCRFALDDFGTGFSTFAYLKKLPIDYLKIDGSLVRNMETDRVDREMVRAINDIGHTVGAKTIAEFVENDAIVGLLREMGVDYAQGYGLQKPTQLDSLLDQVSSVDSALSEWRQAS